MRSSPRKKKAWARLRRDILFIVIGLLVGDWIITSGVIHTLLERFTEAPIIASFVAGLFFTSIFTTAPAIAALYEISQQAPVWQVALVGALGSVLGDLFLFTFIHADVSKDVAFLFEKKKYKRIFHIFHTQLFEWALPLFGAVIIASPLPDELGLAMLGFSEIKTRYFVVLSYLFNAAGILLIGLIATNAFTS